MKPNTHTRPLISFTPRFGTKCRYSGTHGTSYECSRDPPCNYQQPPWSFGLVPLQNTTRITAYVESPPVKAHRAGGLIGLVSKLNVLAAHAWVIFRDIPSFGI